MQVAKTRFFVGGLVAAAALFGSVAAQANLVSNGGFDDPSQSFTGWSTANLDINDGVDSNSVHSGPYAAYFGNPTGVSTISQDLVTEVGATYVISFWLQNEADVLGLVTPNSFELDWGSDQVDALTNADAFGYTKFEYLVTASTAVTTLAFSFSQQPGFWDLDSVDVHVPEPGSLALVGLAGLLALAAGRRRVAASC